MSVVKHKSLCLALSPTLAANGSPLMEVAEIIAKYSPIPKINLVYLNVQLAQNQPFTLAAVSGRVFNLKILLGVLRCH